MAANVGPKSTIMFFNLSYEAENTMVRWKWRHSQTFCYTVCIRKRTVRNLILCVSTSCLLGEGCKWWSRRCRRNPECDKTSEISRNSKIVTFYKLWCANNFFHLLLWSMKRCRCWIQNNKIPHHAGPSA